MFDTNLFKQDFEQKLNQALLHINEELKTIRTGRASPSLVEGIKISVYGGMVMTMKELATITTESATSLIVVPFDTTLLAEIEKALQSAPLGFSVAVEGKRIRLTLPPMSAEQRDKYSKLVGQMTEAGKEMVRKIRDEARKKVRSALDDKQISEDEKFRLEKALDESTQKVNASIDEAKSKKLMEIAQV